MISVELVPVQDVDRTWNLVSHEIVRCLRKAPMEIGAGDIWTNCRSGQWLLIIAHDGAEILGTTVWRFTAHGYFQCVNLVGKRRSEWFQRLIEFATDIAKSNGCRGLFAEGRTGLVHMIKKLDPQAKAVRTIYLREF